MKCARCDKEVGNNVTYIDAGMVEGINMRAWDAVCRDCVLQPGKKPEEDEVDDSPF